MCITNPLKISDFQGNLLHMLLFSQKHAFYFSILRIKEGLSHVQQPLWLVISSCLLREGPKEKNYARTMQASRSGPTEMYLILQPTSSSRRVT